MIKSIFPLIFVLSFLGCNSTEEVIENTVATTESSKGDVVNTESVDQDTVQVESPYDPNNHEVFASIEKTSCYGRCPTYRMEIYFDGNVYLNGIRFIDKIGEYNSHITAEQMQEFVDVANEIDYMNLEDKYDEPVTDIPATITSIILNGKEKSVYKRIGFPRTLLIFEQLFVDLLDNQTWIKIEDSTDK